MPRTRSLVWSELKIGVVTIVAIAIGATAVFMLTGSKGFVWQRYSVKTRFTNTAGLNPGSPVRLAGVAVGQVTAVNFAGAEVEVEMQVNKAYRERITSRSIAVLGSVSLLGESAVDITPSVDGTPIPEWGYVPSGLSRAQIADLADQASSGVSEITNLVRDLREGRGTVGKLLTDERLYTELREFVSTAGEMARDIRQGRGSIGRLMNDRKTADVLEASLKNIEAMTGQLNSGQGSLGKLLKDDAFADSLGGATASLRDLTNKLNRGEGTAGKLMTDASLFNRLNSVTERFDQLVTKLNDGQGTAGQLLKDKQLYENMNGAVGDLRKLLSDIQKDPKKYLNVKVSVF